LALCTNIWHNLRALSMLKIFSIVNYSSWPQTYSVQAYSCAISPIKDGLEAGGK